MRVLVFAGTALVTAFGVWTLRVGGRSEPSVPLADDIVPAVVTPSRTVVEPTATAEAPACVPLPEYSARMARVERIRALREQLEPVTDSEVFDEDEVRAAIAGAALGEATLLGIDCAASPCVAVFAGGTITPLLAALKPRLPEGSALVGIATPDKTLKVAMWPEKPDEARQAVEFERVMSVSIPEAR